MRLKEISRFPVSDMVVVYLMDARTRRVGLQLVPVELMNGIVPHREVLAGPEIAGLPKHLQRLPAWNVDSLVQVKLAGDVSPDGFAQGRTMRNGASTLDLRFLDQETGNGFVLTTLESPRGFRCEHRLSWQPGGRAVRVETTFINASAEPLTLEMLSSFSLGGISPFAADDAPERLRVHRFRSSWSSEGRLDSQWAEELQLERSWIGHGVASERFGQVGSMPVRGFFPCAAVEDTAAEVVWAAQVAWLGSWQMEFYRRDDFLNLSGGLADREFGHWANTVAPGASFRTPPALLTVARGGLDAACQRLTAAHRVEVPAGEEDLPIVFNEWCSSWGNPTHDNLIAVADRLAGTPVRYLVVDDGWAERPGEAFQQNGDWVVDAKKFPHGLVATALEIRRRGLIPGIWFEFEVCNPGSKAWEETDHQLKRGGRPLTVGNRRFWDFRDPWVHDYLGECVIKLLRDNHFGYLKVDYNDTIGIGCDCAETPGEALRRHLAGVRAFYQRIRRELPELVIEICSSGGHRLEPSMLELGAMGSFSDAHETLEIPIIAANLHRLIQPRQSQVWAVLRQADDARRLHYSLAATFLGRMCLSGEIHGLTADQWALAERAMRLYERVAPIVKAGTSYRFGTPTLSYRHPRGWQGMLRVAADGGEALAVVHSFADRERSPVELELPAGDWRIADALHGGETSPTVHGGKLLVPLEADFSGSVVHLERSGS